MAVVHRDTLGSEGTESTHLEDRDERRAKVGADKEDAHGEETDCARNAAVREPPPAYLIFPSLCSGLTIWSFQNQVKNDGGSCGAPEGPR